MDILGDADILRSLSDPGSWLHIYGPILIGLALIAWAMMPSFKWKRTMAEDDKKHLVGVDIRNGGPGVGMDLKTGGIPGSVGMDILVNRQPGQSVTGLNVVNSGSGTGLKNDHTGPGTGVRVVVGDKPMD